MRRQHGLPPPAGPFPRLGGSPHIPGDQETADDVQRSLFITGLKNAHALEKEALSLIDRQVQRLENYPEMAERLRAHRKETEEQIVRLDAIFEQLDEKASGLKDLALGTMGNLAALGHTVAGDEVLKNHFANLAFENFEIASYRSLITMAEVAAFQPAVPMLQETLREEEAMAAWVAETIPAVTRKFMTLKAQGETASH